MFVVLTSAVGTILLISFFDSESFHNCLFAHQRYPTTIYPIQIIFRCIGVVLEEHNAAITAIASRSGPGCLNSFPRFISGLRVV